MKQCELKISGTWRNGFIVICYSHDERIVEANDIQPFSKVEKLIKRHKQKHGVIKRSATWKNS